MPAKLTSRNSWLIRYGVALLAAEAGMLVRMALTALAGEGLPTYITFYPAVMVVALLGGVGPGLVATAASALLSDYYLLEPRGSIGVEHLVDVVGLAFFLGMGVLMSMVAELYRRARERVAAYEAQAPPWERREPLRRPWTERLLINGGMVLSLAILAGAGWAANRTMDLMVQSDRLVTLDYAVHEDTEQALMDLQDMEAGVRGYLLTGREDYLQLYKSAAPGLTNELAELKQAIPTDPPQRQRLARLNALADAKLAVLKEVLELRRTQGLEAAETFLATGRDAALGEEIRRLLAECQAEETRLLHERLQLKRTSLQRSQQVLLGGGLLSFLIVGAVFVFLDRENARRRQAEAEVRQHRDRLQEIVAARTAELGQANDSLRRQREWLHVTLNSIGDAVLAADTGGRVTFLNPVAENLTGWKESEALGQHVQSVFRVINEETGLPGEDVITHVLRDGGSVALGNHTALLARDGREVPIEDSAAPIKDSAGTVSGVVLVFHDVTEKRRAQQAMRESQRQNAFLAGLVERASQAFGVGYPDGRLGLVNRAFEELTGYGADELRGMDWTTTLTPPEWRALERQKLEELNRTGQPVRYEKEYMRKDGSRVPIELLVHLVRDADGKPEYYFSFLTDISERRRAEENLRASEQRLRWALQGAGGGAWDWDLSTGRAWWSQEMYELWGVEPGTLMRLDNSLAIVHEADRDRLRQAVEQAVALRADFQCEFRIRHAARGERWMASRGSVVWDNTGAPSRLVGITLDSTERKLAEDQLQQSAARLQAANASLQESRQAALNLMEDAIEARKRADATSTELRESRERLAGFAAATFEGILLTEQDRIVDCNDQFAQLAGLPTEALKGRSVEDFIAPEDRSRVMDNIRAGREGISENQLLRADGTCITVEAHGRSSQTESGLVRTTAIRDITERKQREALLEKLNRTLQALKDSSQAMMRATSEAEYLAEVCKIIVEVCGHAMVWVGFAENDKGKTVRPVASAGFEGGYLQQLKITWADTERGRGPTGTAIRTGQPRLCRDMVADPAFAPWRAEALQRGYGSALVVPLLEAGKAFGAITIYSREADAFSADEEKLLVQLADDVAYCLRTLRLRAAKAEADREREAAQAALRQANVELEQRVAARTAELHAAARYARNLLEASLDPLVTISPQGKITDVNEATESVTGLARDRLIGRDFSSFFTEPDKAAAGYQRVLAEGLVRDYPLTIRDATGRTTDVLYNASVYRDEAGQVQGVFAAARDITERKLAEQRRDFTNSLLALFAQKNTSDEYLKSVVDVIHRWIHCQAVGIRIADPQGGIPYAAWTGFDPDFVAQENQLSLQQDNCCCIRAFTQAFEEPDQSLVTSCGSYRCDDAIAFVNALSPEQRARYRGNCMKFGFASLAIIPIRYRGAIMGVVHLADRQPGRFPAARVEFLETMTPLIGEAMHRFRTEAELARHRDQLEVLVAQRTQQLTETNTRLEQAAEDLKRSNRDLEQFAYVASHDLQEPLRAVGGYVKLLEHRFPDKLDAKAQSYIAGAFDGATRMEQLISDLLAFSRVATRRDPFTPSNLEDALEQALSNLEAGITSAHATITHDPLPTLSVDAGQIRQLFQNLVGNAIKFRGAQPSKVHVGAQRMEGRWVFSVRDNGIGIDPQFYERIFQIFQRLHTRKDFPGTGIGLAICKRVVERHGGTIWVESRPGEGATFYFSLPDLVPNGVSQTS